MSRSKSPLLKLTEAAIVITTLLLGSCGLPVDPVVPPTDNEPELTITGDNLDTINVGSRYSDPGCTAFDTEDGSLTASVTVDYGTLDTANATAGTYQIRYSVTDHGGNTVHATRTLVVRVRTTGAAETIITAAMLTSCPVQFNDTTTVYVIASRLAIGGACEVTFGRHTRIRIENAVTVNDNATLVFREGARVALADDAYFAVGETGTGTLKALGIAADTVRFSNLAVGKRWGYGSSATYAGGFWFDDAATAACSLVYCSIDSATNGVYVEKASITISHSRITGNLFSGCYFADGGAPVDSASFVDNMINGNSGFGISINAAFAGALSGTGSFAGNTAGAIHIRHGIVNTHAIWKKHDAPYVVEGEVSVGAPGGATLTIRPGASFLFKKDAFISVGDDAEGTIVARGTATDSIRFDNFTAGIAWGYGSSATYSGGFWIGDGATGCIFDYCTIDSATSGIYVSNATVSVMHSHIAGSTHCGIYFAENGSFTDSAASVGNIITGNNSFGISIDAGFAGSLSGTGTVAGNTAGAILLRHGIVKTDAVWKKLDAPYVVEGEVSVGASAGAILTIRPGASFQLMKNAFISVGEDAQGTLVARGSTTDSIRFSNYSAGTKWGYGSSATYSGGFWIDDMTNGATVLDYCVIDSATTGIFISKAAITVSHCRIAGSDYCGIYLTGEGRFTDSSAFVGNSITHNGEFGVSIEADAVGTLSGTGSFTGNTAGGILVRHGDIKSDAVWKKHDAPYVVEGEVSIGAAGGSKLTIRPGAAFLLMQNAYFSVGEDAEGTLVAEGSATDSILFTNYSIGTKWGYGSSATYSGGIWIDDQSTPQTSLAYCRVVNATTGVRVNIADPAIRNSTLSDCQYYGLYLDRCPATKITGNAFSGNGTGDTGSAP